MSLFDCLPSLGGIFPEASTSSDHPDSVDLLLLGSGWTSTFVLPQAAQAGLTVASTTREGRGDTIKWTFDPDSDDVDDFRVLPDAKAILIVFPLYSEDSVRRLVAGYLNSRKSPQTGASAEKQGLHSQGIEDVHTRFILLGSTGIYNVSVHSRHCPSALFAQHSTLPPSEWANPFIRPSVPFALLPIAHRLRPHPQAQETASARPNAQRALEGQRLALYAPPSSTRRAVPSHPCQAQQPYPSRTHPRHSATPLWSLGSRSFCPSLHPSPLTQQGLLQKPRQHPDDSWTRRRKSRHCDPRSL